MLNLGSDVPVVAVSSILVGSKKRCCVKRRTRKKRVAIRD